MRHFVFLLLLVVGAQAQKSPAHSLSAEGPASGAQIRAMVAAGRLADLRWPVFSDFKAEVDRFYRPSYALAWVRGGKPTAAAQELISILESAEQEGLSAEDYDGPRWAERMELLAGKHTDEARFDVALTVCTMRYVAAVRVGRVNPKHVQFAFDVGAKRLDLARFVREELVQGKDTKAALAKIEPPYAGYRRAREALIRYMELASEEQIKLPDPGLTLSPEERYEGVPQLAALLSKLGDLPAEAAIGTEEPVYTGPLVTAVKHFQERHLLYDDGKIDELTMRQLNMPLSSRVEQLRLTMERWRWLPLSFPQPPLVVNIPEFYLRGFGPKGKLEITMNVNVGEAYENKTPIFEGRMTYLVFRPYWDVPASIQRGEIVPSVEEDRDYIRHYDFEVLSANGKIVTDGAISDSVLQGLRSGKLRVRQKPGPSNSLGLVKFMFPNVHSVYLHDTPVEKDMFGSGDRDLSHGCIHVKEPAQLAAWLLRDQKQWTLERVRTAMQEGKDNQRVNLTKAVPVLILYGTAIVEEDGQVYFTTDLYGHDATLEKALGRGYPYPE